MKKNETPRCKIGNFVSYNYVIAHPYRKDTSNDNMFRRDKRSQRGSLGRTSRLVSLKEKNTRDEMLRRIPWQLPMSERINRARRFSAR